MEKKEIYIGNITTIVTSISLAFAGLIIGVLASWGLHLPIDQTSLAGVIGTIIMFVFSLVNAKYHCNFFDDERNTLTIDTSNLTEEQVKSIQNFIDNASQLNKHNNVNIAGREYEVLNDAQIEDLDPASKYEDIGEEDGC